MAIRPEEITPFVEIEFAQFEKQIDAELRTNWSSLEPKPTLKFVLWPQLKAIEFRHNEMADRLRVLYRESGWRVDMNAGQDLTGPEAVYSPYLLFNKPVGHRPGKL